MAYETITDLSCDTVVALGGMNQDTRAKNPTSMEGFYLGAKSVTNRDGIVSFIHVFQTPKGNQGIWGKADTNTKLAQVVKGTMTLVTFDRIVKLNGGKKKYVYTVQQDREQSIEVSTSNITDTPSSSDSNDDYASEESDSNDEDDNNEDADQDTALAAAERKAKMQALLKPKSKSA